jgi:glycosyltransferase involved in cell wall biosynthesis
LSSHSANPHKVTALFGKKNDLKGFRKGYGWKFEWLAAANNSKTIRNFAGKSVNVIQGKKVVVVMPAYNAEKTLQQTYEEVPFGIVDEVILVDDRSKDNTAELGRKLGITRVIVHDVNKGYGGNQKTCYREAIAAGADIVVMLHPDYQYTPKLIEAMVFPIAHGLFPVMLGSRILGKGALQGGMPIYKYIANRFLTAFQNLLMGQKLAEYHTGYRAFSREILEKLPLEENSDDFVFDNEMLGQITYAGYIIGEVTCPTKYFDDASSINFSRSVKYGMGVLRVSMTYRLTRWGLMKPKLFDFEKGKKLEK